MKDPVFITGGFSTGCFCEKPKLVPVEVPSRPRFNFYSGAKLFIEKNDLEFVSYSKQYKVVMAESKFTCPHHARHLVRIHWQLYL